MVLSTSPGISEDQVSFRTRSLRSGDTVRIESTHHVIQNMKGTGNQKAILSPGKTMNLDITIQGNWKVFVQSANETGPSRIKAKYNRMNIQKIIEFGKNRKKSTEKHPVTGKTYAVQRDQNETLTAHLPGNKEISLGKKETNLLRNHFRYLGKPHPLQTALGGQQMNPGDSRKIDGSILDVLVQGTSAVWPEDKELTLTYQRQKEMNQQSPQKAALCKLTGSGTIKNRTMNGSVTVKGTILVNPDNSLPQSAQLNMKAKLTKTKTHKSQTLKTKQNRKMDLSVSWSYDFKEG